jgi:hypothetical protein
MAAAEAVSLVLQTRGCGGNKYSECGESKAERKVRKNLIIVL